MQTVIIPLQANVSGGTDSSTILLLNMMITLFIVCVVGFIARKTGIINSDFSKKLSTLIIKIAQPFLIISSVMSADYSKDNLILGFAVLGIGLLCHILLAVVAFLYTKPIKKFNESKITAFCMIFANCGFLGLPVIGAVLGKEGVFCCAFYVVSFNLFLWSYGMILLGRGRDDIKLSPKKMILNFGTLPCIIGIVLYVLKPYFALPAPVTQSFDYLGSLCTPVSQLIVGGLIATRPLISLFNNYKLYLFSLVKLLVIPSIAIFACKLLGLGEFMTQFIAIMTALPSATNSTMFGEIYDIEPEYAAQVVGTTSILSVLSVPLILMIANAVIAL